jgi:hypothetical protein
MLRVVASAVFFSLALGGLFVATWADSHGMTWLGVVCAVSSCLALGVVVVLVTADGLPTAWRRFFFPNWPSLLPWRRMDPRRHPRDFRP